MVRLRLVVVLLVLVGGMERRAVASCKMPADAASLPQDRFLALLTAFYCYDKHVLPDAGLPLDVAVKVYISHLEAVQSRFTAYLTVQLVYEDPKLNFEEVGENRSAILGDESVRDQIWTPHVRVKNQDSTTVVESEQQDVLVAIDKTGVVTYSYKMVSTFYCWMDLKKFPFDTQKCGLSFSDWSYNNEQLKLRWTNLAFGDNLHFTEFVLEGVEHSDGSNLGPYEAHALSKPVGDFSELTITFKFHREIGFYLLDFYIPSFLLVFTAWVTFWLQADAGPPRATLGASTVVAFITLHLGVGKDIPKVSYVKASDIWFLGISCFIFFSLAEFAFVNVIWRRKKVVELKKPKPKYIIKGALMPSRSRQDLRKYESQMSIVSQSNSLEPPKALEGRSNGFYQNSITASTDTLTISETSITMPAERDFSWTTMTPQEVATYIDRKSRIFFPLAFLIFNVLYWVFVYYG